MLRLLPALLALAPGCALVSDDALVARMDLDGDGLARPDDCDDDDAGVAGASPWYADGDGDGYGGSAQVLSCAAPEGFTPVGGDCDDTNADANPGAEEICDALDDDCDGATDEDDAADATTWHRDADGDGYGTAEPDGDTGVYTYVSCGTPEGYVASADDCDDGDPTINPGEREACDGRDEDCSGVADDPAWYPDADGDGYGSTGDPVTACEPPEGYAGAQDDCDDTNASIHPGAAEVCDDGCADTGAAGCDEDCDGAVDDEDTNATGQATAWLDADGDGYGDPAHATPRACELAEGYSWLGTDCDDGDPTIHPEAEDACYDGLDADCDGGSDDDCDRDGYDEAASGGLDCDDANEVVNPDALEACANEVDENCDGELAGDCALSGTASLSTGTKLTGTTRNGYAGFRVLGGVDLLGDGGGDILVGAPYASVGGYSNAGILYVVGANPSSGSLSASAARIEGAGSKNQVGYAAAAGDFNGDGQQDLATGGPEYSGQSGAIWWFPGPLSGTMSDSSSTVSVIGNTGVEMATCLAAGDLDGDGIDDLAFGSPGDSSETGTLDVVPGQPDADVFAIPNLVETVGETAGDRAGSTVAVGDADADGVSDLLIGAKGNDGAAYVVLGPITEGRSLADADAKLHSGSTDVYMGTALDFLGDTDGDGRDDYGVAASFQGSYGTVYLYTSNPTGDVPATSADVTIAGTSTWYCDNVAHAGDVNGDLVADVLVGDHNTDTETGSAYLWFGPIPAGSVQPDAADAILTGESESDYASYSMGSGDTDKDGYSDIIISAPYDDDAGTNTGAAYVFLGG